MKQSAFDSWLTTQNDEPAHFVFDITSNNYDWSIEHSEIDGSCYHCNINLGINSDHGNTTNYWQIDIDAELLFCDECYETLTAEIGETVADQPLICCCQEGWCSACQIHGETKCSGCNEIINWNEDGGHIYPDGQTLCANCEIQDGETK